MSRSAPTAIEATDRDWQEQIRKTTRIMVDGLLLHPVAASAKRRQEARLQVISAAGVALGDASTDDLVPVMLENALSKIDDGGEMTPEALPGMFRVFLMERFPDWRDAIGAESVMVVIQHELDRILADRPITDDEDLVEKILSIVAMAVSIALRFPQGRKGKKASPQAIRTEILRKLRDTFDDVIDDPRQLEAALVIAGDEAARILAGAEPRSGGLTFKILDGNS